MKMKPYMWQEALFFESSDSGSGSFSDLSLPFFLSEVQPLSPCDTDCLTCSLFHCDRFPKVTLTKNLLDSHVYVFKHSVLDLLSAYPQIESVREELVPWLVKGGFQTRLARRWASSKWQPFSGKFCERELTTRLPLVCFDQPSTLPKTPSRSLFSTRPPTSLHPSPSRPPSLRPNSLSHPTWRRPLNRRRRPSSPSRWTTSASPVDVSATSTAMTTRTTRDETGGRSAADC